VEVFHGPSPPFPFNPPLRLNQANSSTRLISKGQVVAHLPLNMCITHTWTFEVRGVFVQLEHHKHITKCIREHDQSIIHMYATNQSKFRESKTFSSLRSLQKVFYTCMLHIFHKHLPTINNSLLHWKPRPGGKTPTLNHMPNSSSAVC
jgi:hypothetical protein